MASAGHHFVGYVASAAVLTWFFVLAVEFYSKNKITFDPDNCISFSKSPTGWCFEIFFCCFANL